jgi:hypothetical protein
MHIRRLICFMLGLFLAGNTLILLSGYTGHLSLERVLSRPAAQVKQDSEKLGSDSLRSMLRHQMLETVRYNQEKWDYLQLLLLLAILLLVVFGTHEGRLVVGFTSLLLLIAGIDAFLLSGDLTAYGRLLDFEPADRMSPYVTRYRGVRLVNSYLEGLKMLMASLLSVYFFLDWKIWIGGFGKKVKTVDDADHRHVNR